MEIIYTETFEKLFAKLPKQIQQKAIRKIKLFEQNPFLPILHVEKLYTPLGDFWSFRIDRSYRVVFSFLKENKAVFHFIGHHNQIYRLLK
jgi:mRNA-degrading endonuclease RelE of RelBE toxin-antitoxin system